MCADSGLLKHLFVTVLAVFDTQSCTRCGLRAGVRGGGVHGVVVPGGGYPGVMVVRHRGTGCGTPPGTPTGGSWLVLPTVVVVLATVTPGNGVLATVTPGNGGLGYCNPTVVVVLATVTPLWWWSWLF